ncbi:hypothetical protein KIPB_005126, partial [Kipferlia bialata]
SKERQALLGCRVPQLLRAAQTPSHTLLCYRWRLYCNGLCLYSRRGIFGDNV